MSNNNPGDMVSDDSIEVGDEEDPVCLQREYSELCETLRVLDETDGRSKA